MTAECFFKDKKFTKYSPGCGGQVRYPTGYVAPSNPIQVLGRTRPVKGKSCYLHYLEAGFGLIALECPKCAEDPKTGNDKIQAETDVAMEDLSKYTYVPMELVLAPARHTWFLTEVPAFTIRCWHCGFVFFKGRKATKAEHKKNDKIGWEQIPQASGKLLEIIRKGNNSETLK